MNTKRSMKHWTNAALWNRAEGWMAAGRLNTDEYRDLVAAKDELRRRGFTSQEVMERLRAAAA